MLKKFTLAAALIATSAFSSLPASAQDYPFEAGGLVEMSGITIKPGGGYQYATYLASEWRKRQEFAKSKGWITDYRVHSNLYAREGEPNIYLVTWMPKLEDAAEANARELEWRKFNQRSDAQMVKESGDRAQYRTLSGSMLLAEMVFKK